MAEPEVEAAWRAELNRIHDTEAFRSGPDDPKAAFRWSGDEAEAWRLQEEHAHHYLRWTFVCVFAAMIVGVIGVGLSFLH
jgi:RimJ/RimL family protein N-acetyltransferase